MIHTGRLCESTIPDKIYSDAKMNKLAKILIANGKLSDKGNYVVKSPGYIAYYSPKAKELVVMDAIWGSPKYVFNGSEYYKKNIEGKKAKLTRATLIKWALEVLRANSLDDYNDDGSKI